MTGLVVVLVYVGGQWREVAQALGVELSGADVFKFPNDNIFVRLHGSVRSRDVFIIQPTCPPVNTSIMQLLIYIDTMKRDSAGRDPVAQVDA